MPRRAQRLRRICKSLRPLRLSEKSMRYYNLYVQCFLFYLLGGIPCDHPQQQYPHVSVKLQDVIGGQPQGPHPGNGSSSFVGTWRWHKEKPLKQARAVTPVSQFLTINSYRASLFSRFFLLWCKPEERRLFLLRLQLAEACFGARRSRRRNKGRSPCITARVLFVFVRIGTR